MKQELYVIMAYEARWYVEERIVFVEISGDVTLEEIKGFDEQYHTFADAGTAPVHMVLKCKRVKTFPLDIGKISRMMQPGNPEHEGWLLLVSSNSACQFISQNVTKLLRKRYRACETLDEAFSFLCQIDDSLPCGA